MLLLIVAIVGLAVIGYIVVLRTPATSPTQVEPPTAGSGLPADGGGLARPPAGDGSRARPGPEPTTQRDEATAEAPDPPWRQHRLSELDAIFDQLKQVRTPDAGSDDLLHQFFWLTIAPIQDARGEYEEPVPGAQSSLAASHEEHVFSFRNRIYRFPRGQYPAYDEMMTRWSAVIPPPDSIPGQNEAREWIPIDATLLGQMEALKARAQVVIRARREPY